VGRGGNDPARVFEGRMTKSCANQMIGRTILGRFGKEAGEESDRVFSIEAQRSVERIKGHCRRLNEALDRTDADIFEGDDEKAAPDALAAQPIKSDGGAFGEIAFATAYRFCRREEVA